MSTDDLKKRVQILEKEFQKVDEELRTFMQKCADADLVLHRSGKHYIGYGSMAATEKLLALRQKKNDAYSRHKSAHEKAFPEEAKKKKANEIMDNARCGLFSMMDMRLSSSSSYSNNNSSKKVSFENTYLKTLDKLEQAGITSAKKREELVTHCGEDFILKIQEFPKDMRGIDLYNFVMTAYTNPSVLPLPNIEISFTPELWQILGEENNITKEHAHFFCLYLIRFKGIPFMFQMAHRSLFLKKNEEEKIIQDMNDKYPLMDVKNRFQKILIEVPVFERNLPHPKGMIAPADFLLWAFESLYALDDVKYYIEIQKKISANEKILNEVGNNGGFFIPDNKSAAALAVLNNMSSINKTRYKRGNDIFTAMRKMYENVSFLLGFSYVRFTRALMGDRNYLKVVPPYADVFMKFVDQQEYDLQQLDWDDNPIEKNNNSSKEKNLEDISCRIDNDDDDA